MKKKRLSLAALAAVASLGFSQAASAHSVSVDIIGNVTNLELTSFPALTSLGISASTLGTAKLDAGGDFPIVSFAITGGTLDPNTGFALIEHDGSGLGLTDGISAVSLENFLINTETGLLSGDVSVNDDFVANIDLLSIDSNLVLTLTSGAADALNGVFGTALPTGLEIGIATVDVAVVPVPAALPLMFSALAGLGFARRRSA